MLMVQDWMSRPVIPVTPSTSVKACAEAMVERALRHLPVVDDDGALLGYVSDLGVLSFGLMVGEEGDQWLATREGAAADVMMPAELVALPVDAVSEVLQRLAASLHDAVIVVDRQRRPVGILTEADGVNAAAHLLPEDLSVEQLASAPPITIDQDAPATQALEKMAANRTRHVLVTDADGALRGVLSVRDLLEGGADLGGVRASERCPPRTLHLTRPTTPLRNAARTMAQLGLGCLPLVDHDLRPVAVITRTDVISALQTTLRGKVPVRASRGR